ncbi:MFS transporter [Actinomadura flavalba]|uniref:MFS transporter n=1 Tax=Actinomadura flavalba TaxID=1120938 RepID=UPI0003643AC1|nr:MFS transporter [Actinomadura flavalba]
MNPTQTRAGLREWLGLAVLALPTLLLALDITVLHLAVPHLSAALAPSSTQLLWTIDIYAFMIAGFLVTMGTLGDRIGRRRLLLIGATAFGAASALAAYATSPEMLIAARTLLGIAGATLMPSTLSLISNMFRDPQQRGLAIGVWATMFSAGIAVGPVVGGVLLEHFWWGSVLLLGVPVMVVLLVAAPFLLPEFRSPGGRLDLPSVLLSLAAMLPATYGIKETAKHGLGAVPLAALAVGVLAGVVFVRRQRRLPDPLLDLALFRERRFTGALVLLLFGTAVIGGSYLFVNQYLQMVEGLSPLRTGLWLLPAAVALVATSMAAPVVVRRVAAGPVLAVTLVVMTAGFLVLTQAGPAGGLAPVVTGMVLAYAGIGPLLALGTDLVVGAAPPERAGAASAVSETSTEIGGAIGIAVLGSVGTALYRAAMASEVPAGTPASDGLAGAVASGLGDAVLVPAREAFTSGLVTAAWICAAVTLALAVVALTTLRDAPEPVTADA